MNNSASKQYVNVARRRRAASRCLPLSLSPLLLALLFILLAVSGCVAPVRVEWRTETEMNTIGFNLYRGESAEGPFDVKVNDQLIPSSADALTGASYSYIDRTARAGVIYYYQLEEVEQNGRTNTFGPISVRAGGLAWWHLVSLVALGGLVAFAWLRGGKTVKVGPPPGGKGPAGPPGG